MVGSGDIDSLLARWESTIHRFQHLLEVAASTAGLCQPIDKLFRAFLVQLVTADQRKRHHGGDLFRDLRLACSSSERS